MKRIYIVLFFIVTSINLNAQEQKIWLLLKSEPEFITNEKNEKLFKDKNLENLFTQNNIYSIQSAFPYSKNDTLIRLYEVICPHETLSSFINNKDIEQLYFPEEGELIALYEPTDPMWGNYYEDSTSVKSI